MAWCLLGMRCLLAQSSDASVRGSVTDLGGKALEAAVVSATNSETGSNLVTKTDSRGVYSFAGLLRGLYTLTAAKDGYQHKIFSGVELAVGDKHEQDFVLESVSSAPGTVPFPEPEAVVVGPVPRVSVVVDERKILQLPLASRNIYALFLLQPGVTSQGGIVRRGLSFSVHGQRVSGSNYRLDGVDNNNIILTGPVAPTSAEAVQEFRYVSGNFSAEDGRATAFVVQVATRAGTNRFHGSLFEYLANDKLNSNTFENNANSVDKPPLRRNQFGVSFGGPLRRNRTFFWSALEFSRLRHSGAPKQFTLPTQGFINGLPEDSVARRLLTEIPPIPVTPESSNPDVGTISYEVPNRLDAVLGTVRLDHNFPSDRDRLVARYTASSATEERDREASGVELFSGYPDLRPTDSFRGHNALLGWTHSFRGGQNNELRIGWSRERFLLPRPHPEVPVLESFDGVPLPGSARQSDQRENNNVVQLSDSFSARRGRSSLTVGLEYRRNFSNGATLGLQSLAPGGTGRFPDGFYFFSSLADFGQDQPLGFGRAVDRFSPGQLRIPDLHREYRSNEYAFFVQDDFRLSRRLSLNIGLRYEYFGVPHNIDRSKDVNFYFGEGSTIEARVASGVLRSTDQNPGDLTGRLYRRDLFNFAPSIGLAWDPIGKGKTVVRAGYAVALDRVFDTLRDLRTNSQQVVNCVVPEGCFPLFLIPAERMLPNLNQDLGPAEAIQLDENLRTPYAQNWYAGVQQSLTGNTVLEIGHAASVGRKLISRDLTNRSGGLSSQIGEITFLSNAGNSNYVSLEIGLRQRFSRGLQFQAAYTLSHVIDNQSDPFEGVRIGPDPGAFALASFTRQFDARSDRGNASFDQRHNLVFNAIYDIPAPRFQRRWPSWLLGGWTISMIGGHRSGFPATAIYHAELDSDTELINNRVDFVGSGRKSFHPPVPGGVQWLDPEDFRPAEGRLGSLGRGALRGPGFWNYDFALLKNFGLREEGIRVQFRAEFYNLFNHANLSVPVTAFARSDFGQAFYGRNRTFSRFGDLLLENPARTIQFALRIQF